MALTVLNARILTLSQPGEYGPRRGKYMRDLGVIERGWIRCENSRITSVGTGDYSGPYDGQVIDAGGNLLLPAFVDCHTHACWAGDRLDEFEMMNAGASYLDILKAGGGIMATVRAVREASEDQLVNGLMRRLASMAALGTGTVEIKSGYGLDPQSELKMLRAIHAASRLTLQNVIGTFLGAHAVDPDNPRHVNQTIEETLPAVLTEFPHIACDAYCEEGAWGLEDCRRLFEAAREMGSPIRVHSDQFNSLGMTRLAIDLGAVSVDHLESITPKDLEHLARSQTIGVCLPGSGFHLDGRYAPARAMIDAGVAVAIATNYNPGSSPTPSMPFAIALACRKLKMTAAEAITAATYNAACVLDMHDVVGTLEIGKRADMQLIDMRDERELGFEIAAPGPLAVILGGEIVHMRSIGSDEHDESSDDEE